MENKKSRQFYFGNNADGNGIFPSLRFYRYQKILLRFSGSKVLEVFRWQHQCSGRGRVRVRVRGVGLGLGLGSGLGLGLGVGLG